MSLDENLWLAVTLQVITCVVLFIFILSFANFSEGPGKRFVHLGPSTDEIPINVTGVSINTWKRWIFLMSVLVILEAVNTYTFKKYKTWYRHGVLAECHTGLSTTSSMFAITLWRISTFIPSTFKWLAAISTQQLQFLVPALLVRTTISNIMDYQTLGTKEKKQH